MHFQSIDDTWLLTKLYHAKSLIVLFGPTSILHFPCSLKTVHQIVQTPFVFNIAYYNSSTNFLNFTRIIKRWQSRVLWQIIFHKLGVISFDYLKNSNYHHYSYISHSNHPYLLWRLSFYPIYNFWWQLRVRFLQTRNNSAILRHF